MDYRTKKRFRRWLCGGLAGALSTLAVAAGHIWHWTDRAGQQHYSDHLPPSGASNARRLDTGHPAPAGEPPGGLRGGERARLQRLEVRSKRRRREAEALRSKQARTSAAQRTQCRQTRSRWYATRDRQQGKEFSDYLRAHCW